LRKRDQNSSAQAGGNKKRLKNVSNVNIATTNSVTEDRSSGICHYLRVSDIRRFERKYCLPRQGQEGQRKISQPEKLKFHKVLHCHDSSRINVLFHQILFFLLLFLFKLTSTTHYKILLNSIGLKSITHNINLLNSVETHLLCSKLISSQTNYVYRCYYRMPFKSCFYLVN
jgi:hypothetical protein